MTDQVSLASADTTLKTDLFASSGPPKPHLVIRVGITGHRREALHELHADVAKLSEVVKEVLGTIQVKVGRMFALNADAYAGRGPIFRLISPLAEGSDRIVAREAFGLGFALECPFPFPEADYKNDFKDTPRSLEEFCELRQYAGDAVFELDGKR